MDRTQSTMVTLRLILVYQNKRKVKGIYVDKPVENSKDRDYEDSVLRVEIFTPEI